MKRNANALFRGRIPSLSRVGAALALAATLAGCSANSTPNTPTTQSTPVAEGSSKPATVVGLAGGCEPFTVYAQNRWEKLGAVVRSAPSKSSVKLNELPGNTAVQVDGYIKGEVAIPENQDPYKGEYWFHDVAGGWITSAALRETPTEPDPTGLAYGGPIVPLRQECLGRPVS